MILVVSAALAQVSGGAVPATNGQLFRPTIDGTHTLWSDDSGRAPDGYFVARGLLQYARNPVLWTGDTSGDVNRLVGDLFQLDVLAGYTKGPIRLGVDVPIYLRNIATDGGESGLGDVALDVKATILERVDAPVGLAIGGRAALPTTTIVDAPLGNRGFAWELSGIVDHETGPFLVTGNVGVRGIPRERLENFDWGTQLVVRAGAGYAIVEDAGISFDLGGHFNVADLIADATPVEGIVGGWYRYENLVLRGGVGTGFTSGFGAPQLRTLLSVAYEPPRAVDTDGDGLVDRKDECPENPEDLDGFRDDDGCPEPTQVTLLVQAKGGGDLSDAEIVIQGTGKTVRSGQDLPLDSATYTVDVSAPGYVPLEGQVLNVPDGERHRALYVLEKAIVPAELVVKVLDPDGKAIDGATWAVRNDPDGPYAGGAMHAFQPGTYQVRVTADGYRGRGFEIALEDGGKITKDVTLEPARVQVKKEKIDIRESIYFETGKAIIKPESFGLLDEVAQAIVEHPELVKIRIEGHTDSRGSASSNLKLSKDRAKSVLDYLVGKGVEAGRLESEGYGESKPIEQGENEAAWSKNRRVDFFVAERSDDAANPEGGEK
ncbi:MAG: OmpA family protein [Alphaproteobacteria bacterium]|nr:OmpA family protein [Alphaproteobacteria bacterium]